MAGGKDNIGRQIQNTVLWSSSILETVGNRTCTYTVLLRMTDTMTSQNIDLSSWDTLYMSQTNILNSFTLAEYIHFHLLWSLWTPNGASHILVCQIQEVLHLAVEAPHTRAAQLMAHGLAAGFMQLARASFCSPEYLLEYMLIWEYCLTKEEYKILILLFTNRWNTFSFASTCYYQNKCKYTYSRIGEYSSSTLIL
jgi:hypothetical protein